jgi:hypothetical protein
MGVPFWYDDPDAWDRIEIAGFEFADTDVDVDGDLGNDFDVQKAAGADGAPATNKGYDPCKPKVSFALYTKEHFETYQALLAKVQPKPGKTPPPVVDVIHPKLQLVKKQKFKITKLHLPKKNGIGILVAAFDLLEYFPDPKPVPKPADTSAKDDFNTGRRAFLEPEAETRPSKTPKP